MLLSRKKAPYGAPLWFTFCADLHRMELIMAKRGWTVVESDLSLLLMGIQDVALMAENMVIAAESLGMETATEQDTAAFGLYRSLDEGSLGQSLALFPAQGGPVSGASYRYRDANVEAGVLYYYALQEVTSSGGTITVARANAGIEVPTQTRTPTLSSTLTPTPTPRPKLYLPLVLR